MPTTVITCKFKTDTHESTVACKNIKDLISFITMMVEDQKAPITFQVDKALTWRLSE